MQLLCRDIKSGKRFSLVVFRQDKNNDNFYGAKDSIINFGDAKIKTNDVFIFKVSKNKNGNMNLLEAEKV